MSLQWAFSVSHQTCGIVELFRFLGKKQVLHAWCTVERIIVIDDYKLDDMNLVVLKTKRWK